VKVGPSPEWLRKSLEAIGQKSINNVVDATNLVMFNTGQALHAFDAKRLGSLDISVRLAENGEQMEALDEKTYTLTPSMLVIAAGGRPVGIAGVKGGMADRIDENTTDILLEAATFDGPTTRKTAAALKLRTDASARFEQVISPELAAYGMQQAVDLIAAIAGGKAEGFVDEYPAPLEQKKVSVSAQKINTVLGTKFDAQEIAAVFTRLDLPFTQEGGDIFTVTTLLSPRTSLKKSAASSGTTKCLPSNYLHSGRRQRSTRILPQPSARVKSFWQKDIPKCSPPSLRTAVSALC
jgi:phenylalanyl-tRNA synthetase beta chain